ncbi:MAG: magnesium transporter [Gammaproteobacteria bacterium]|nr:magnesium transporter [Gammaproteobacteria bacterium]MYG13913.1 magnesium transporter [Gammaproteobacteria bacterium]
MSVHFEQRFGEVLQSYGAGTLGDQRHLLRSLKAPEVANLLEATPPKVRRYIWDLIDDDDAGQVLQHLGDDVLSEIVESMDTAQLVAAADDLDVDDQADLLQQLPDAIAAQVLNSMDSAARQRVESVLSYAEDSAGGLMDMDVVTVHPRHALEIVLRYLRLRKELPKNTDALIVVNSRNEYVGTLPLSRILTSDSSVTVREVMEANSRAIPVGMPDREVAAIFAGEDLVSAPVLDHERKLLGRITIDDVVDVIAEDADEAVLARAGLDPDEDTFAPVMKSARRRAIWLGINLITAFLAAAVINVFEATIGKVVALAVLLPIVASMGGIAGTQTLTLMIRGIVLGHVNRANLLWLMNREFAVALLNGLLWASLVALAALVAFQDPLLGMVIAVALVINLVVAVVSGSLLPSILNRLSIDPAIAGGVILTTITDVTGFFVFLGLAAWAYA